MATLPVVLMLQYVRNQEQMETIGYMEICRIRINNANKLTDICIFFSIQ